MGMWIGRNRKARVTYGFDEIALVPGSVTVNPNEVDTSFRLGPHKITVPILASAMDGVVDVGFAIAMGKLGGVAVLNLEGVQTRYKSPEEVLDRIVNTSKEEATHLLQRIYTEPIQEDLVAARVRKIKDARRPVRGQFDSATRGAFRRDCPGSRCRHFCGSIDGVHGAPYFQ